MQRLLDKYRAQLQLLETLDIKLQSEDGAHADRADSEGDRDPCANSGDEFDSLSDADTQLQGHSFADHGDDHSDSGSVADGDSMDAPDSDADQHGDSCAGVEFQVDPNWNADLANVSIASDDIVSDDGVDDDDGSITAEWIRLHRAKVLSRVTNSLEWMRSFGQVIAVTSALKFVHSRENTAAMGGGHESGGLVCCRRGTQFSSRCDLLLICFFFLSSSLSAASFCIHCSTVAATLCPHCFDANGAPDNYESGPAVNGKKWADCPLLRHLAHLQRPGNMTRYGETTSAEQQRHTGATLLLPAQSPPSESDW